MTYTDANRRYSGPGRTGICVCGHAWDYHHGNMVMNQEYFNATGEAYYPGACEYFGCNEMEGLDLQGNEHCSMYRDSGLAES